MGNAPKVKTDSAVRNLIQLGTQMKWSQKVVDDGNAIVA
jgi:hypothetical protein